MKFEEFYFNADDRVYSLEELLNIYKNNKEIYKQKYYNHMYCPKCHIAELSFHSNAITPYLRTKPLSIHKLRCSCNYEPANKKQLDKYNNNNNNFEAINRKLKGCIDLLIKPQNKSSNEIYINNINAKNQKNKFIFETGGKRVSIRRKKITFALQEPKDYNLPMLFYGCVKVTQNVYYDEKEQNKNLISITRLTTIQMPHIDINELKEARSEFSKEEWIDIILISIGIETDWFDKKEKWLLFTTLIPLVENNFNLCKIGSRSIRKSHSFKELSPNSIMVSGGQTTVANLFYNNEYVEVL